MPARRRPLPTKPAPPLWKTLLALLALVLAAWWGWSVLSRPRDLPVQPGAQARTVAQDWAALRAFGPRPAGSAASAQARAWLSAQLEALGYRVSVQDIEVTRSYDRGGQLRVGGPGKTQTLAVTALPGSLGGEQQGRLVRVPPDAPAEELERLGLRTNLALTTCPAAGWRDLTERALSAGAFGLVAVDDCPARARQRVTATPLPLVTVPAAQGARVLALAGRPATLVSNVEERQERGANLLARRVGAAPEIVVGAHLDTLAEVPGANDNTSGVLAVLEVARRAAGTPLAGRLWLVLFDAEEDGLIGSRAFVDRYPYELGQTRAMLNLDMVGVDAQPLGVAGHLELLPLARAARPGVRVFTEAPTDTRETFGRSVRTVGRSDHVPFQIRGTRTLMLHRGLDPAYHTPRDTALDPALVQDTAAFTLALSQEILKAPWTPVESCGILARDCRD